MVTFGGLWLCLWQGAWRRWGTVAIAAGLVSIALTRPPDVVIANTGRFVAARAADGGYFVNAEKGEKIALSSLAQETGEALTPWPEADTGASGGLDCGKASCLYTARGQRVAIVTGEAALPLKCSGLDAIVSQVPAGFRCRSMMPVIDRIDSWRRGAVALWLDENGVTVESANEDRGDRPWVPHPHSRRQQPSAAAENGLKAAATSPTN
jgi:competence protein ComEC